MNHDNIPWIQDFIALYEERRAELDEYEAYARELHALVGAPLYISFGVPKRNDKQ